MGREKSVLRLAIFAVLVFFLQNDVTLAQEKNITKLSLRDLSITAAQLWNEIEAAQQIEPSDNSESDNSIGLIIEKLMKTQNATESKIDSIVWVKEMLESEVVAWKERRERALLLYNDAIQVREDSISQIKQMLIHLYESGLICDRNVGKECEIEIRNNPPKVASLKMEIDYDEFPSSFKRVVCSANNQAILDAHKAGIDVTKYADITVGKQVRFKRKKSKNK